MTKTVFRTFPNGNVIAIFPEIPATSEGHFCQSYMQVGRHGAAAIIPQGSRPSTREEIDSLKPELEKIGYKIQEIKKVSYKMNQTRRENARS